MTRYAFIDTETTGLHPDRQAWEVAVIVQDGLDGAGGRAEALEAHQMFIDVTLADADPHALDIGGFFQRHPIGRLLSGADSTEDDDEQSELYAPVQAGRALARITHKCVLVANNPVFDVPLLEGLVRGAELAPTWHYRPIDVIAMAAGYAEGLHVMGFEPIEVSPPPWHSDNVSRTIGIDPPVELRHTALGDAGWARLMFNAIVSEGTVDDIPGIAEDHAVQAARKIVVRA